MFPIDTFIVSFNINGCLTYAVEHPVADIWRQGPDKSGAVCKWVSGWVLFWLQYEFIAIAIVADNSSFYHIPRRDTCLVDMVYRPHWQYENRLLFSSDQYATE